MVPFELELAKRPFLTEANLMIIDVGVRIFGRIAHVNAPIARGLP
jgi:hypothetical protein